MGSRLEKNSTAVRKRIENHTFDDEGGEEYEGSKFGGFSDYFRRKKIKLQNLDAELRSQSTENPPIFRGIVAHVNGYTQPSLNDLHNLIVRNGGGFQQYLDGKTTVTHVIASNLTPKKRVEFAKYRIVKPAWIVDSVAAGKVLPWESYRLVDEGVTQKVLGFDNGQVVSQVNDQRKGYKDQTDTCWYTTQVKPPLLETEADEFDFEALSGDAIRFSFEGSTADEQMIDAADEAEAAYAAEKAASDAENNNHAGNAAEDVQLYPQDGLHTSHIASLPSDRQGSPFSRDIGSSHPVNQELATSDPEHSPVKRKMTAEEHNAMLLSNPHLAKSSTANPDFLNQYYRESRLHHLSTWKADLKSQLQARALEKSSQEAHLKKIPGARRYILHVDFDSFFAAVSLRNHPHLKDKPVVIAHGSGPGSEIASCNYPARQYGVKNGMWMKSAVQLCSTLEVLPYDYKAYEEASKQFYDSILSIDGVVQSISIDEALIDVSRQCIQAGGTDGKTFQEDSISREQAKATEIAQILRTLVKEKTQCDVSVGIGSNILLAKVALRKAKPAGQHLIKPEDVLDVVGELVVRDLPGVAYSIGSKLEEIGVKYVKDIRAITKERLINTLGPKTGEKIWDYSRGVDKVEVGDQAVRKSVSAEVNWGIRFVTQQQAEEFVQCLCDELHKRLREQAVKGKQLTMKIMRRAADAGMDPPKSLGHGKCDTFNKSVILGVATNDKAVLGKEAISILRTYAFSPGELRGLGVQMQKLEPLKSTASATSIPYDSNQRRLQFKKPESAITSVNDMTANTDHTSKPNHDRLQTARKLVDAPDLLEDVPSPEKQRGTLPLIGALRQNPITETENTDHKPLNIAGTQFVLPTQIDPSVLDELPSDIRANLAPRQKSIIDSIVHPASARSLSPKDLPAESQIDPAILEELPEDVRDEILAYYKSTSGADGATHQKALPQSPRKMQPTHVSKKLALTPAKKQKLWSAAGRGKSKTNAGSGPTLTQSNFIAFTKADADSKGMTSPDIEPEISQSFLEELPEDIRAEILAEQKRNRMKTKSGLNLGSGRKKFSSILNQDGEAGGQRLLRLQSRPETATFTSRKLSTLPELREAMSEWVSEFSGDCEEGPDDDDLQVLVSYLEKVVCMELNMEKAVSIVNWIMYEVNDKNVINPDVREAWDRVEMRLKSCVQDAVRSRGLPPIKFTDW